MVNVSQRVGTSRSARPRSSANTKRKSPTATRHAPGTSMLIRLRRGPVAGDERERAGDGERRHDHVDPERPPPRVVGGEEPTDHGTQGDADADRRAPRRERGRALAALERGRQHRQRRRQHERRADALDQRFADDEARDVPRERGEQRSAAEQRGADHEDAPVAVHVAEATADDEEAGERERVAGDDPLDGRESRVEVAEDRGDRDGEHRVVEHHDERGDDDDRERHPAARVREPGGSLRSDSAH